MARWTSQLIRVSKQIVFGLIVLVIVWFMYSVSQRYLKSILAPVPEAKTIPSFADSDVVKFVATSKTVPSEVTSDKTADAILSGAFGPAVVVFYADWCVHCQNMSAAYEEAAKAAGIPFVRVQGSLAPVSSRKYGVTGYPTILGVANVGGLPRRFAAPRTKEALLEFAMGLSPADTVIDVREDPAKAPPALPAIPATNGPPGAVAPVPTATPALDAAINSSGDAIQVVVDGATEGRDMGPAITAIPPNVQIVS